MRGHLVYVTIYKLNVRDMLSAYHTYLFIKNIIHLFIFVIAIHLLTYITIIVSV